MQIAQLYADVTATIIKDLEAGTAPWVKPWKNGNTGGILPRNAATNRSYNGINIPILWHAQITHGYRTACWMTYKQAQERGAQVRAGEKSTHVVFTKNINVKDEETDEEKKIGMLKAYSVFNVAQIDGLEPVAGNPSLHLPERRDAVTSFIAATKADIRIGGDRACYVPALDFVCQPPESAFKGREHFLATSLHETIHWSGHKTRLDRDLKSRFNEKAYAAEELIAELGAAFLCAHLGITGELKHADYIASWIDLLKGDDRAIFTAASQASKAADYLRAFSEAVQEEA
ncbi:MAG: ssDNA-binding domain-containing protein [Methylacidiphilales bacterium]|nr:ssDNA-binding domain-containing protein [Candidatus Methylacidiphilales bacterium]